MREKQENNEQTEGRENHEHLHMGAGPPAERLRQPDARPSGTHADRLSGTYSGVSTLSLRVASFRYVVPAGWKIRDLPFRWR
jgi:hypothetical protein